MSVSEQPKTGENNSLIASLLIAIVFLVVGIAVGYLLAEPLISRRFEEQIDASVSANMQAIEETIRRSLESSDLQLDEAALKELMVVALAEVREEERQAALAPLYEGWDDDPYFGPEDASVVMVEFSDFRCNYCGRFAIDTLPLIREEYGDRVRFIYRDFPIFGELSLLASMAGQCALAQGDFWKFHDALFLRINEYTDSEFLFALAEELGYESEEFAACVNDARYIQEVQLDFESAQSLGLNGTPGFYINGEFISGAQSFQTFAAILDEALAAAAEG